MPFVMMKRSRQRIISKCEGISHLVEVEHREDLTPKTSAVMMRLSVSEGLTSHGVFPKQPIEALSRFFVDHLLSLSSDVVSFQPPVLTPQKRF
jgi:hypothetical protein